MSVYSLCFSPTGGTKKVLDILGESLSVDTPVDLSKPTTDFETYDFSKDDICLIGVPSFGGRVPAAALERIKKTRGQGALAIIVVVFGNRAYDDTLFELKNEVDALGFEVGAAIAAVAEHSIMRQFGEGRPDSSDEADLSRFAEEISKIILNRDNIRDFEVPGNQPYKEYSGVPMKPKADKSCTQCGLCSEKCPVEAIPKEDSSSLDENKCISCMRCIAICPEHARKVNKAILLVASQTLKKACSDRKENELYT